jgi:hypothetical protein
MILVLIPIAWLVALPVLLVPARPMVWLALAAGTLCATGAIARSVALAGAGGAGAIGLYTAAILWTAAPPSALGAVSLGVALFLLLEGTAFRRRFHGASVRPAVVWRQALHWAGVVSAAIVAIVAVDGLSGALVFAAPSPVYATLAAASALGVVVGAVAMLTPRGEAGPR